MGAWRTPREGRRAATLPILTQFRVFVKTSIPARLPSGPPTKNRNGRSVVGRRLPTIATSGLRVEAAGSPFGASLREALHRLGKQRGPVILAVLPGRDPGIDGDPDDVAVGRRRVGMLLERGSQPIGLSHGDRPVGFGNHQAKLAVANPRQGVDAPRLGPNDG